ncbi:hypothetical protein P691DRAFT_767638 [Macrolepiota fuliginosa MF-IS2]|uniref:Uncharacterized protein n=1 Tax=Macrolepiota fuliginosa MF-IS2 TaxID=1400762 RepID=A0A9P6BWG9_9AGAR|nr:hypothetical protein P691DRAFT_767638 [Macrolepiota fuliginosa MF-IS2]
MSSADRGTAGRGSGVGEGCYPSHVGGVQQISEGTGQELELGIDRGAYLRVILREIPSRDYRLIVGQDFDSARVSNNLGRGEHHMTAVEWFCLLLRTTSGSFVTR